MNTSPPAAPSSQPLIDGHGAAKAALWRQAPLRQRLLGTTALCGELGYLVPRPPQAPLEIEVGGKRFRLAGADPGYRRYFFDEVGGGSRVTLSAAEFHRLFGAADA